MSRAQNKYFLEAWVWALTALDLDCVKDIDFSWISENYEITEMQDKQKFGTTDITIHFSKRNPFDPNPDVNPMVRGYNLHIGDPQLGIVKYLCV